MDEQAERESIELKILYGDKDLLVVDKPAGIVVFPEGQTKDSTLIDLLVEKYPELKQAGEAPRYGVAHRLDKGTSGVLLVAKTTESLIFFQKQFKNREVTKMYLALATGKVQEESGTIHTLMGRSPKDPRMQKAYPAEFPIPRPQFPKSAREAITEYRVAQRFENYTLLEVEIRTGRKHQIRCHLAYIHHPIAGDDRYGFKDSPRPEGLRRQFLHACSLTITLPGGERRTFTSPPPHDLQNILNTLS